MKKRIVLFVLLVFLTACTSLQKVPRERLCVKDADCVPSACCHPEDAVNRAYAPDCSLVECTQECRPGTIDCNQGEIKCLNNECKAVIY